MNTIHNLSTGPQEKLGNTCDYGRKLLRVEFILFYAFFLSIKLFKKHGLEIINNVQGNPKSVKFISFYTGFCPTFPEYFELTSKKYKQRF